ncbi:MAG: methyltransferase domain-containing protein [Bryobacterales bacterium]|nr:methyltransferase domain-containing protein [Bryobacterales bacterium]MBL8234769.1 methyltransferase domain-containing protein [Bryobacterales bacterium]
MERLVKALVSPVAGVAAETKIRAVRGVYDIISDVYPLSSRLFHRDAHATAIEMSEIENGMHILEVATGSGELYRQLTRKNAHGLTLGVDLSPRMAHKTQKGIHANGHPLRSYCNAADIRNLPFRTSSFDRVFVCILLELLPDETIWDALREVRRVLKPEGKLILVFISQRDPVFNAFYAAGSAMVPSFLGRLVEENVYEQIPDLGLEIVAKRHVRQLWYPSTIVTLRKV